MPRAGLSALRAAGRHAVNLKAFWRVYFSENRRAVGCKEASMKRLDRRRLLTGLAAASAAFVFGWSDADGAQRRARVVRGTRRRVRRRVRRRIRRPVVTRVIAGRPAWVVPLGLAVGWELVHDNRVVVVKEIKTFDRSGAKVQVAVVEDSSGKREEVDIFREDTSENSKNLEGSILADSDKTTPGVEKEEEVEVDE
jgi:hypothetical protein